jgi:putative FmdB family regulatory protein
MPKYDFACQACRAVFEIQASLAEYAALTKERKVACAACGSSKVMRVFTPPNLAGGASHAHSAGCGCQGGKCG